MRLNRPNRLESMLRLNCLNCQCHAGHLAARNHGQKGFRSTTARYSQANLQPDHGSSTPRPVKTSAKEPRIIDGCICNRAVY